MMKVINKKSKARSENVIQRVSLRVIKEAGSTEASVKLVHRRSRRTFLPVCTFPVLRTGETVREAPQERGGGILLKGHARRGGWRRLHAGVQERRPVCIERSPLC